MIKKEQLTGIVLAGGQSSRFGSNKAMECMDGKTFLMRAIELLQPLCAAVAISGIHPEYAKTGCRMLKDEYEACGPLSGIHAALKSCHTEYALFLTCDMPLMESAPLLRMLAETPAPVIGWCLQETGGGIFPLLVSTSLTPKIEQALKTGNYSIRHSLCKQTDARMLNISYKWQVLFTNINHREDLHTFQTKNQ